MRFTVIYGFGKRVVSVNGIEQPALLKMSEIRELPWNCVKFSFVLNHPVL